MRDKRQNFWLAKHKIGESFSLTLKQNKTKKKNLKASVLSIRPLASKNHHKEGDKGQAGYNHQFTMDAAPR